MRRDLGRAELKEIWRDAAQGRIVPPEIVADLADRAEDVVLRVAKRGEIDDLGDLEVVADEYDSCRDRLEKTEVELEAKGADLDAARRKLEEVRDGIGAILKEHFALDVDRIAHLERGLAAAEKRAAGAEERERKARAECSELRERLRKAREL